MGVYVVRLLALKTRLLWILKTATYVTLPVQDSAFWLINRAKSDFSLVDSLRCFKRHDRGAVKLSRLSSGVNIFGIRERVEFISEKHESLSDCV